MLHNALILPVVLWAGVAAAPSQDAPFVRLRLATFGDHATVSAEIEHRLMHAEGSLSPLTLGNATHPWCDALTLRVEDAIGPVRAWKWQVDKPDCSQPVQLDHQTSVRVDFNIPNRVLSQILHGDYQLTAALDLRDAGTGWMGRVESYPLEVRLPLASSGEARPATFARERAPRSVPVLVHALEGETDPLRRRDLAYELDRTLIDAPQTPVSPYSDGAVALHLRRVLETMASPLPLFDAQGRDFRPEGRLLVSPNATVYGAVSSSFQTRVVNAPQGPGYPPERRDFESSVGFASAATPAALQDALSAGRPAIFVHPLRVKDGVTRVAISVRAMGSSLYTQPAWVGFYQRTRDGKAWATLSMEPPAPESDSRDWLANIHPRGPGHRGAPELSDSERRQWLALSLDRIGGLRMDAQWREPQNHLFQLEYAQDKSWSPRLEATKKVTQDPLLRAALSFRIGQLGGTPVPLTEVQQALREVKLSGFEALAFRELWPLLDPHFQRESKLAAGLERDELMTAFGKRAGRSGDAAAGAARIWDKYAAVDCQGTSGHGTELYERTDNGWRFITFRAPAR